jgi:23S rRNA pseudouridine955/2504/2580 synthase
LSGAELVEADAEETGLRLDRWFKRHYPELSHGRLQKLLRTGQVRLDGKRVKAGARLEAGQKIRVPPFGGPVRDDAEQRSKRPLKAMGASPGEAEDLRSRVLHMDDDVIVLDKPAGLAVQGGTKTHRHLDAMLDALRFGADERPRLVHRLDKDTAGVLVIARNARAAAELTRVFRTREARKLYWAVVAGVPKAEAGRITLSLAKKPTGIKEKVIVDEQGKGAVTLYRVIDKAGSKAAWLALEPLTGRTHQLRVHAAALGTPILGDGKYGGKSAFLSGGRVAAKLHLLARSIRLPRPGGGILEATAPLPGHMRDTWEFLGFDADNPQASFLDI